MIASTPPGNPDPAMQDINQLIEMNDSEYTQYVNQN